MIIKIGLKNLENREKWLEKTLKSITNGNKILDAGAGELKYKHLCSHLEYKSQDFGGYNGQGDNRGNQTKEWDQTKLDYVSDITNIPVNNESFDAIMCIEVFEHIPEPIRAIEEFSRILKNDGKLIITAPFSSIRHFSPYFFYPGFSDKFYEEILPKYGFKILEIDVNGNYFEFFAQELRRLPHVVDKYFFSNKVLFYFIKAMTYPMLWLLTIINLKKNKSSDMLCFGYHILAQKNNQQ